MHGQTENYFNRSDGRQKHYSCQSSFILCVRKDFAAANRKGFCPNLVGNELI